MRFGIRLCSSKEKCINWKHSKGVDIHKCPYSDDIRVSFCCDHEGQKPGQSLIPYILLKAKKAHLKKIVICSH